MPTKAKARKKPARPTTKPKAKSAAKPKTKTVAKPTAASKAKAKVTAAKPRTTKTKTKTKTKPKPQPKAKAKAKTKVSVRKVVARKTVAKKTVTAKKKPGARAMSAKTLPPTKRAVPRSTPITELDVAQLRRPAARSGKLSGDLQGLETNEDVNDESVAELMEEGNFIEAEAVSGVEAADAEEGEVRTHEVSEDDVPDEYLNDDF